MLLKVVYLVSLLFLFCCNAFAVQDNGNRPEWNINELMRGLSSVKSAKGKFVERKYLRILNKPLEFSGTLTYTAPDKLEKLTLLPKPESLILDRDKITIENKAKNQKRTFGLQDYAVVGAFVESIRSTLAGDLKTLNRFYQVRLEGSSQKWKLVLVPIAENMKAVISEIRITGSQNKVSIIEVIEAEGDRSVMTIVEDSL